MKTAEIRRLFLDFFRSQEHAVVPSSNLVPDNDPSLLFTNAGMVQFKDVFTGTKPRPCPQATTAQKCLRAGGKHNDLDQVGYTARHHTFFEMLGNFSFGEYFKERAIEMAWTFLTRELRLPKERLCVTVFHEDTEASELWQKIAGVTPIPIATADNFWSMGDTGPCGPCSEIFYDHGEQIPGGPPGSPEENGDRFVEIWNLVFMQFNQQAQGERVPLPKPSIDTGMGLERIAAVMQGVTDNYDTDIFCSLRQELSALTSVPETPENRPSFKAIVDHLRAAVFLCAEGVMPGPDGRSYVLRRIIRRAVRHGHALGIRDPFLHRLMPVLVRTMGEDYPELRRAEPVSQELEQEEVRFRVTLERGLHLLEDATKDLSPGGILPGEVAFKLYDTYGFPLDLTEGILRAKGQTLDKRAFEAALQEQKTRSQWAGSGDAGDRSTLEGLATRFPATRFCGYEKSEVQASVVGMLGEGREQSQAREGEEVLICLDTTPFYATSGGQKSDKGTFQTAGASVEIQEVRKTPEGVFLHTGFVTSGTLHTGDAGTARLDLEERHQIAAHHSATHLLHAALHKALGAQVVQKGSSVEAERLRFDFNHSGPLPSDLLDLLEEQVNRWIRANLPVCISEQEKSAAISSGAMALFGEKYQNVVRVVQIGEISLELCGGTHVPSTGCLGVLRILSETGIGSGIRRIEAVAGEAAYRKICRVSRLMTESARLLNSSEEHLPSALSELLAERDRLRREVSQQQAQGALSSEIIEERLGEVMLLCQKVAVTGPQEVRSHVDALKKASSSRVIVVFSEDQGEVRLYVGVSENLKEAYSAVTCLKEILSFLEEAGGGGRSDFAQGGGRGNLTIQQAIESAKRFLSQEKPT
ncbi:MAG: alanine--tRNA ligase [Holosporales bacterium]|jgi:alanyl-tRNA synthetase|nr:alanine--tRNA ligase [Holosporales bacterium]